MEARRRSVESDLVVDVFFTNVIRGKDGLTPHIGENGNWWIGDEDTGVPGSGIPSGVIVMWSGSVSDIPFGWKLCNGEGVLNNGSRVPDLRGRFVVGYDSRDLDYSKIGGFGGSKNVTLTEAQMPRHQHYVKEVNPHDVGRGEKNKDFSVGSFDDSGGTMKYTSYKGDGEAHENRPPYYVLAYIIKL